MGPVLMLDNPTTRGTSSTYHIIPSYADTTTNATYGVCEHANYSYDTCDLNTISISPICRYDDQRCTWGLSTRRLLLRHVRPQHYQYTPYAGTTTNAAYGVCQHAGYSYDTCELNTISISPIYRYDDQRRIWGLSTRRLLLRHLQPQHNINIPYMPIRRPTPHVGSVNTPATPTTSATSQAQGGTYTV
ncbi:unnamed protein product [Prunus armeniaca]